MKPTDRGKGGWISQFLFVLSLLFLAFGLFNLGWVMWPPSIDTVQFVIPAGVLPGAPAGETFASLSEYELRVSWPQRLRASEAGTIVVELTETVGNDLRPHDDRAAQVVLVEPVVAGLVVSPPGLVQVNLADQQEFRLTWEAEGSLAGEYPGKVYVSFGFYDQALAEMVPVPVAVVDLSIRVTALWGLEAGLALWFGLVGIVLWGALFLLGKATQVRRAA